jgi:hypothetical protein
MSGNGRDDFRVARRWRRLGTGLLLLLITGLFLGINCLAGMAYSRRVPSPELASPAECVDLVRSLKMPLRVLLLGEGGEPSGEFFTRLHLFLENVHADLQKNGMEMELTVLQRERQAGRLGELFPTPSAGESGIYLRSGEAARLIPFSSCLRFREGQVRGFAFAPAFFTALRSLADAEPAAVYFLTGHGERSPEQRRLGTGLSRLQLWLGRRGWHTESLEMARLESVPPSRSILLIADPRVPFAQWECALLQRFLEERRGKVLLLLTPESVHGLDELLAQWRVQVGAEGPVERPSTYDEGIPIHRYAAAADFLQPLIERQLPVLFDSVRRVGEGRGEDFLSVLPLMEVESFAQKSSFPIAASARKCFPPNIPVDLPSGRLVVIGGDFLSNRYFALTGNQLLFQQLAAHLLDQPVSGDGVQAEDFQLSMGREEWNRFARVLLLMPFLPLALVLLRRLLLVRKGCGE